MLKTLIAGTSLTKLMDRKHHVRDGGHHDNRAGMVEENNICTRAFKLLFEKEDRQEDPDYGADHLVGGDYCVVIVESKTIKYSTSESVQMVICKYWRFGDVTGAQLEESWSQNGGNTMLHSSYNK